MATLLDFARNGIPSLPDVNNEPDANPVPRRVGMPLVRYRPESKTMTALFDALALVVDEAELVFTPDGLHVTCAVPDATIGCHVVLSRICLHSLEVARNEVYVPINVQKVLKVLHKFQIPTSELVTVLVTEGDKATRLTFQSKGRTVPSVKVSFPVARSINTTPAIPVPTPDCSFTMSKKQFKKAIANLKSVGPRATFSLEQGTFTMSVDEETGECTMRATRGKGNTNIKDVRGHDIPANIAPVLDLAPIAKMLAIVSPLHDSIGIQLAANHPATFTTCFTYGSSMAFTFALSPNPKTNKDDEAQPPLLKANL